MYVVSCIFPSIVGLHHHHLSLLSKGLATLLWHSPRSRARLTQFRPATLSDVFPYCTKNIKIVDDSSTIVLLLPNISRQSDTYIYKTTNSRIRQNSHKIKQSPSLATFLKYFYRLLHSFSFIHACLHLSVLTWLF